MKSKSTIASPVQPIFFAESWHPDPGQRKGVEFLVSHGAAGLFADPGVGKTSITYKAFCTHKKAGTANRMLVVAPLRPCYMVWPLEQQKWKDFKHLKVVVLHGPKKEKALEQDADIYVINPEGLEWLLGVKKTRSPLTNRVTVTIDTTRLKRLGCDTLVIDELSRFGDPNTVKFKALKQVLGLFSRRWGLTGSPAANGLMGLFGQCYMLDMGRSFGQYITKYRSEFFVPGFDGFSWQLMKGAEQKIYDRIKPLVLRLEAKGGPEIVERVILVDLPPAVRKIYDSMEEHLLAQIDERTVTAAMAGAASMKCQQIASGGIYLDPEISTVLGTLAKKQAKEWVNLHDEKTAALVDLINELQGQQLLVAYDFRHDLDRIEKALGIGLPVIGGGVSPKKADEILRAWNAGEIPYFFGHPKSMGHGINAQGSSAHHICWYSLTWDYELYDQFIRRLKRRGSDAKTVFVHRIVARNTIDEDKIWALRSKGDGQEALFKALLARKRSGLLEKLGLKW